MARDDKVVRFKSLIVRSFFCFVSGASFYPYLTGRATGRDKIAFRFKSSGDISLQIAGIKTK